MELSVHHDSPASVEQMFTAHLTQEVREEACRQSGATAYTVTITPRADGGATVAVDRTMPARVPDFIRRIVGDYIEIIQVEEWAAAGPDGVRRADIRLTIKNQPASMHGAAVLKPSASGSSELVTGMVKVAIPIIGRKIEPEIVKVVMAGLRLEQQVTSDWAAAQPT